FSSARSRTLHVLMTTTSASAAASVASKPACSRSPAIRSESWTFIWQPKVSIRYLRATLLRPGFLPTLGVRDSRRVLGLFDDFRFRPFAFAPGVPRAFLQHLTRRPSK